jgi:high-affinity iron transporter
MVPTFVIFLREGIEATMIVAILLAYLDRIGQRRHFRDVAAGVAAALVLATAGGIAAYLTIRTYAGSRTQAIFETATYLLAAGVLTYMTFWMTAHARTLRAELAARADAAFGRGARFGLGLAAFQAVGREGLETMVFTLAIVFASSSRSQVALGAAVGLAASLALAVAVYRLGRRLNVARFFTVLGALLMVFAAGLLANAVENLQQLGWVRLLSHPLWDTGGVLPEDSALGDVFHSFFGYSSQPSVLQLVVYLCYLAAALSAYFWVRARSRAAARPA